MNAQSWRLRMRYYTLFLPLRWYLAAGVFAAWMAAWWLLRQQPEAPSLGNALFSLLLKATATTGLILLAFAFLSVLVPWVLLWFQRKKLHVQLNESAGNQAGNRTIHLLIHPLFRPAFGFLYYRLVYDQLLLSPRFTLAPYPGLRQIWGSKKEGEYQWPLPAIREYQIDRMVVYFEDLFHLFSLCQALPVQQSFFIKPSSLAINPPDIKPNQSQEENIRTDELKRVEGEYLHYKNFEDSDDVRRIVWKIYARRKELVVRIPEILDPFASHVYFYTSFSDGLGLHDRRLVQTRALDFYKNACFSIYHQLVSAGHRIRFFPDQPVSNRTFKTDTEQFAFTLSACHWMPAGGLLPLVPPKGSPVVCISSLTAPAELEQLLQRANQQCTLILVLLSGSVKRAHIGHWLKWIFIRPEPDWEKQVLSPGRSSDVWKLLRKNEKQLQVLTEKYAVRVVHINYSKAN